MLNGLFINRCRSGVRTGMEAFSSEAVPPFGGTCPALVTRLTGTLTLRLSHPAPRESAKHVTQHKTPHKYLLEKNLKKKKRKHLTLKKKKKHLDLST